MTELSRVARPVAAWLIALALGGSALMPAAASAQEIPSYARPAANQQDETIQGRIVSIDGKFAITVNDDRGFTDNVQLHEGTIINPTGLTLAPGMSLTILGFAAGNAFIANQIDTPYTYSGPPPVPVYYGAGWWYPGYAYGYGPSFSLFLNFGSVAVVQRPWYGYWYVHPYVQPWAGYRAPYPVGRGSYHNVAIVNVNVQSNHYANDNRGGGEYSHGQPQYGNPGYAHSHGSPQGNGNGYATAPHGAPEFARPPSSTYRQAEPPPGRVYTQHAANGNPPHPVYKGENRPAGGAQRQSGGEQRGGTSHGGERR